MDSARGMHHRAAKAALILLYPLVTEPWMLAFHLFPHGRSEALLLQLVFGGHGENPEAPTIPPRLQSPFLYRSWPTPAGSMYKETSGNDS